MPQLDPGLVTRLADWQTSIASQFQLLALPAVRTARDVINADLVPHLAAAGSLERALTSFAPSWSFNLKSIMPALQFVTVRHRHPLTSTNAPAATVSGPPQPRSSAAHAGGASVAAGCGRLITAPTRQAAAASKKATPMDRIPRIPIGRNDKAARSNSPRRWPGRIAATATARTPPAAPAQSNVATGSMPAPTRCLHTMPCRPPLRYRGVRRTPPRTAPRRGLGRERVVRRERVRVDRQRDRGVRVSEHPTAGRTCAEGRVAVPLPRAVRGGGGAGWAVEPSDRRS